MTEIIHKNIRKTALPRTGRVLDAVTSGGGASGAFGSGSSTPNYWRLVTTDDNGNPLPEGSAYLLSEYSVLSRRGITAYATDGSAPSWFDKLPIANYDLKGILRVDPESPLKITDGLLTLDSSIGGGISGINPSTGSGNVITSLELSADGRYITPDKGVTALTDTNYAGTLGEVYLGKTATAQASAKLSTARTINGTGFDGTANIVTNTWGATRPFSIASHDFTGEGATVNVNGFSSYVLPLPSDIKVNKINSMIHLDVAGTVGMGDKSGSWARLTGNRLDGMTIGGVMSDLYLNYASDTRNVRVDKDGNLIVSGHIKATGSITAYATDGSTPSWFDSLPIAGYETGAKGVIRAYSGQFTIDPGTGLLKLKEGIGGGISGIHPATGAGNVITSLSLSADGKYITPEKGVAALTMGDMGNFVTLNTPQTIYGQKAFSDNIKLDGTSMIVGIPVTIGNWARGFVWNSSDFSSALGSLLMFGGASTPSYISLGFGDFDNTERLFIAASGKVGIGIANPAHKLHVIGAIASTDYIYANSWFQSNSSGTGLYNSAEDARWYASGGRWVSDKPINITGLLNIQPLPGSYAEGIRIGSASNGWSNIQFGVDTSASTGFVNGQWLAGKNPANTFMICPAGTEVSSGVASKGLSIGYDGITRLTGLSVHSNSAQNSISTTGGVLATSNNPSLGWDNWHNYQRPFTVNEVTVVPGSYYPVMGWSSILPNGYRQYASIGSLRSGGDFGRVAITVGRSDNNQNSSIYLFGSNGTFEGATAINTGRIICGYDSGVGGSINCSDWFRNYGDTGWFNAKHGGGMYMIDSTYVKVYGNKCFAVESEVYYSLNNSGGYYRGSYAGSGWNSGRGALNIEIFNNNHQTPLIVAARGNGFESASSSRLFAMELLNSGSNMVFAFGAVQRFTFTSGGSLTAQSAITAYSTNGSDMRRKTVVSPRYDLDPRSLLAVRTFTYNWNADTGKTLLVGMSAQQMLRIAPDFVMMAGDDQGEYYTFDYGRFGAIGLIKTIQHVIPWMDEKDRKIIELENRVKDLEDKLNIKKAA